MIATIAARRATTNGGDWPAKYELAAASSMCNTLIWPQGID